MRGGIGRQRHIMILCDKCGSPNIINNPNGERHCMMCGKIYNSRYPKRDGESKEEEEYQNELLKMARERTARLGISMNNLVEKKLCNKCKMAFISIRQKYCRKCRSLIEREKHRKFVEKNPDKIREYNERHNRKRKVGETAAKSMVSKGTS